MADAGDVLVSVPPGGVNDEVDEWLLEPPNSAVANNLWAAKTGSLTKLNGFSSLGSVPTGSALIPATDKALLLGTGSSQVINEDQSITNVKPGAARPLGLKLHRVLAGDGFVHDAQLAHANGYTCVAYSILGNAGRHSGTGFNHLFDYEVRAVILDEDMEIVWGPEVCDDLQYLPRVEALTESGNNAVPVFVVFGAVSSVTTDTARSPFALGTTLNYVLIDSSLSSVPSSSSVGTLWATQDIATADRIFKYYDTVSDLTNDVVYVAGPFDNSSTKELRCLQISESGSTLRAQTLTATTNDHMALYVSVAADTLLVYDRGDSKVWYGQASTMGALSSIAAPTFEGIDSAASNLTGIHQGDRAHTPEWYLDTSSLVRLNTRQLVLTGSGPGTPSFGSESSAYLPHCYTPTALGSTLYGFYAGSGGESVDPDLAAYIKGASTLEMYHLEAHTVDDRPTIDLPILESRLGRHNHKVYVWSSTAFNSDLEKPFSELPCVTGQVAVLESGNIILASSFLQSQQKNRNSLVLHAEDTNDITLNRNGGLIGDETDGAGYYNDEQVVGIVEISDGSDANTTISVGTSEVVAAGCVSGWAVDQVHPIWLRAPNILSYDATDSKTGARALDAYGVGIRDQAGAGSGGVGTYYDWDYPFRIAVVLVFTDPSGREIRSAPTPFFDVDGIGSSEDDLPSQCPVVNIEVPPGFDSFFGDGKSVDAELYVTKRDETESDSITFDDVDNSTATMVCRMPIQYDSTGLFFYDTLQDFAVDGASTDDPSFWPSPTQDNALYTVAGELAPSGVPAMSVVAQAGDYVFGVPQDDPHELWVSKPLVIGRAPEFSPLLTQQAPASGGGIVSLAGLYDRLIVICERGVWELPVLGGPDALGAGAFPPYRLVYRGERCVGHEGTVETPDGVFYVTSSGPRYYGGQTDMDIGRSVSSRLDWENLSGSVYLPEDDLVVWASTSGMVLFDREQWTTSDLGCNTVGRLGENLLRLRGSTVLVEDSSVAYDGSSDTAITAEWRSPWVKAVGTCVDNRYRRIAFLLRQETTPTVGNLTVNLRYDYDDTVRETKTWTAAELAALPPIVEVTPGYKQEAAAVQIGIVETTEEVDVGQQGEPVLEDQSDIRWTLVACEMQVGQQFDLSSVPAIAKR